MKKEIATPNAPAAIGPYSQGIVAGSFAFVSGQLPVDPSTGKIESQDIEGQARQSLQNVENVLREEGYSLEDVVKTTCFIADMKDFAAFNEVYAGFFKGVCPARSCVAVKQLPKEALCEVEVIAYK